MITPNSKCTPIPPEELESYQDAEWALHDLEVQRLHDGAWVVAHKRQVIARGSSPQEALQQAEAIVGGVKHLAVYCAAEDPSSWVEYPPDTGFDFSDA